MAYTPYFPKFILAIDFETSGCGDAPFFAAKHQAVSFGAAIIDTETWDPVETLYREIRFNPDEYEWSYEAEGMHGLTIEHLETHGDPMPMAACALADLVLRYMGAPGPYDKVMILGHRVAFDREFLTQLMASADLVLPIHSVLIDSATMGAVHLHLTGSENIFNAIGLPERGVHNALQDVLYTVKAIKFFQEVFMRGLEASA